MFDVTPSMPSTLVFAFGWTTGWLLLWRLRPLSAFDVGSFGRGAIAVVIPARNEQGSIGNVVASIARQMGPNDELVVVNDRSRDETASIARSAGATVVEAPELLPGWAGKPHACFIGAQATIAPLLVFIDADVSPSPDLLDRLAAMVAVGRSTLISVQPWHTVGKRWYEPLSWPFNVVALMGSGRFSVFGGRVSSQSKVAFGPVLACGRDAYAHSGGHAHNSVRSAVAEDIALAQRFDRVELFTGSPDTSFRMYPGGVRTLIQGWTKNIASGAAGASWWCVLLIAAWVWSLAGGWLTSPWFYLASAIQVFVLTRRVGRFPALTSVLYPVGVLFFLVVFCRSFALRTMRRSVVWKGRSLSSR